MYKIVEKNNPLVVHALCDTLESANKWLTVYAPSYVAKGFFMDKSLTTESFEVKLCTK